MNTLALSRSDVDPLAISVSEFAISLLSANDVDPEGSSTLVDDTTERLAESDADSDRIRAGTIVAGSYRVLSLIGRGAMGRVYEVEHVRTGRVLAMKVLTRRMASDPEVARRFVREAVAISCLYHPSTVQVFDHGTSDGLAYIVMERIRGETLGQLLKRQGPLSEERTIRLVMEVCSALAEAHAARIIHRDVKPDNVMVVKDAHGGEAVKVLDFGLAKLALGDGADVVSSAGTVLGTPHYMAPEQIRADEVDARSDVYAVGALMYRMLTGRRPFSGSITTVMTGHLTLDPIAPHVRAPAAGISYAVSRLVMKALAKDPADRFQSAAELRAALAELLPERESTNGISGTYAYERELRRGSRAREIFVFVVATIFAVLVAWAFFRALR